MFIFFVADVASRSKRRTAA